MKIITIINFAIIIIIFIISINDCVHHHHHYWLSNLPPIIGGWSPWNQVQLKTSCSEGVCFGSFCISSLSQYYNSLMWMPFSDQPALGRCNQNQQHSHWQSKYCFEVRMSHWGITQGSDLTLHFKVPQDATEIY